MSIPSANSDDDCIFLCEEKGNHFESQQKERQEDSKFFKSSATPESKLQPRIILKRTPVSKFLAKSSSSKASKLGPKSKTSFSSKASKTGSSSSSSSSLRTASKNEKKGKSLSSYFLDKSPAKRKLNLAPEDRPCPKSKKMSIRQNVEPPSQQPIANKVSDPKVVASAAPKIESEYEKLSFNGRITFESQCPPTTARSSSSGGCVWKYKTKFEVQRGWEIGIELQPRYSKGSTINAMVDMPNFYQDHQDPVDETNQSEWTIWVVKRYKFVIELVHRDQPRPAVPSNPVTYRILGALTVPKRLQQLQRMHQNPPYFTKDTVVPFLITDNSSCHDKNGPKGTSFQAEISVTLDCLKLKVASRPSPAPLSLVGGNPDTDKVLNFLSPGLNPADLDRFKKLRKEGRDFDITLKAGGSIGMGFREFRAHKAVLAIRSTIFAKHTEEKCFLEFVEMRPSALECLLDFCYEEKCPSMSLEDALKLMEISQKSEYDLPDLLKFCEIFILSIKDQSDAKKILEWADAVKDKMEINQLRDAAADFIKRFSSSAPSSTNTNQSIVPLDQVDMDRVRGLDRNEISKLLWSLLNSSGHRDS